MYGIPCHLFCEDGRHVHRIRVMYIASEKDFEELIRTFGAKCDSAELPQIYAYKFELISTFSRSDDRMKDLGQKVLGHKF